MQSGLMLKNFKEDKVMKNVEYKKNFNSDEEAIAYYKYILGKQETVNIEINHEPVLLCGTPMVDDIIEDELVSAAVKVTKILNGKEVSYDDILLAGAHNTLIEAYYEFLQQTCEQRVLYISEEY